jgi:hypothetical protein
MTLPGPYIICQGTTEDRCWECGDHFCQSHLRESTRRSKEWKVCAECEPGHLIESHIYRANIKTASSHQYAFALANECFGFGWAVDDGYTGMDWETYCVKASASFGEKSHWKRYMDLI